MVLKISPKGHWGGEPHKYFETLNHPVLNVVFSFVTHTQPCYNLDDCRLAMRSIQKINMINKKMSDIQYNFMVGGDGWVYEGRGWDSRPVLCHRLELISDSSILIGYLGDLQDESFNENIWHLGYDLVEYGFKKKYISPNFRIFEETPVDYYNE